MVALQDNHPFSTVSQAIMNRGFAADIRFRKPPSAIPSCLLAGSNGFSERDVVLFTPFNGGRQAGTGGATYPVLGFAASGRLFID